jgi:hypothetical protein
LNAYLAERENEKETLANANLQVEMKYYQYKKLTPGLHRMGY